MRVLVTGARGFIGRSLVFRLGESGYEVTAFVRATGASISGARQEAVGDMTDCESLEKAVHGVDAVVHLAALKSDESDSHAVNVGGMRNLIAACKDAGVGTVVYVSSASTKLARQGVYGATKKEAEEILLQSGLRATILRPSLIYGDDIQGAFGALVKAARLPFIPMFGAGTVFYPLYVDDMARAIEAVLTHTALSCRIYDVGGPEPVSFDELLCRIRCELLYRPLPHILHISPRLGIALARILRFCMKNPPITESNILGSMQSIVWDGGAFSRDFGFVPRTLMDGFRDIIRRKQMKEADILYAYVYSRSGLCAAVSAPLRRRYFEACAASSLTPMHPLLVDWPMLIGPLDAVTRLFYPKSPLRRRLVIASALAETDPSSAPWLYPRTRTLPALVSETLVLGLSAVMKIIAGSLLALLPGFVKTYAK